MGVWDENVIMSVFITPPTLKNLGFGTKWVGNNTSFVPLFICLK